MKKILSIMVLVMLAINLTGCSSDKEKKAAEEQNYIKQKMQNAKSTRDPKL